MSWQQYVERHLAGRTQVKLAEQIGVSQTAVSRWRNGTQGVDAAIAIRFARAVGDDPLRALIAAGFLTPDEAKARVTIAGRDQVSADQLLAELALHLEEGRRDTGRLDDILRPLIDRGLPRQAALGLAASMIDAYADDAVDRMRSGRELPGAGEPTPEDYVLAASEVDDDPEVEAWQEEP